MTEPFDRTFLRTLIEDVLAARTSIDTDSTGSGRRNAVRATFAAIEGDLWLLREDVLGIATSMHTLSPLAGMALREETYVVRNNGTVMRQVRSLPLASTIKLIEGQARLIAPDVRIRYDHSGWQALQNGLKVRNRITHPKTTRDLIVTDDELATIERGFHWLLATTEYVLASVSLAHRQHLADLQSVVDKLVAGDPETLRAYEQALAESRDEE